MDLKTGNSENVEMETRKKTGVLESKKVAEKKVESAKLESKRILRKVSSYSEEIPYSVKKYSNMERMTGKY